MVRNGPAEFVGLIDSRLDDVKERDVLGVFVGCVVMDGLAEEERDACAVL